MTLIPPQPIAHHQEINTHALSRKAQEWAFKSMAIKPTQVISHASSFSVHNKLNTGLPFIMDAYALTLYTRAHGKSKPIKASNAYAIESDDPKAGVPKNEYTNDMSDQYDGNATNAYTSAIEDMRSRTAKNDIPKMGYSQNKASYSSLKLSVNAFNFLHSSHRPSRKARVGNSRMTEFESLMDVGTLLLKEGEQGLDGRLEVGVAVRMLKEAGARFAAASAINPSSLSTIDSWGITLLVHGKLKLLLSEKLRDMLLEARTQGYRKDSNVQSKVSTLEGMIPKVCEECEKLLVEAGRKFGMAISMDQRDDLALFNWGLALFYRARLIASDDFEDAAQDADKIYLAAIDKFKATSKFSTEYSEAAFLSWGLALRDQCWLHHSMATEERIKILEQASWALEQARQAYPSSIEVKSAVEVCSEELEQLQKNSNTGQRGLKKGR